MPNDNFPGFIGLFQSFNRSSDNNKDSKVESAKKEPSIYYFLALFLLIISCAVILFAIFFVWCMIMKYLTNNLILLLNYIKYLCLKLYISINI